MKENKLGFFGKIKKSVAIPVSYEVFLKMPLKQALGYVIILSFFCSILVTGLPIYRINKYVNYFKTYYQKILPEFTYENGKIHFAQAPKLVEILDYKLILSDAENISITSQGEINGFGYAKNAVILLSNKMIFKNNFNASEFNYPKFKVRFMRDDLIRLLDYLKWIFIALFLFGIIIYGLKMLLYIAIANIFAILIFKYFKKGHGFKSMMTIGIFSLTCPMLIHLLLEILGININLVSEGIYVISLYYLWKAASTKTDAEIINKIFTSAK